MPLGCLAHTPCGLSAGYRCYAHYLKIEVSQSHPVMKAFCGLLLQTTGQDSLSAQRMRDAEEGLWFYFFITSVHDNKMITYHSLESNLFQSLVSKLLDWGCGYCFKSVLCSFSLSFVSECMETTFQAALLLWVYLLKEKMIP